MIIMSYLRNILISADQFLGSFVPGSFPDETISARAHRQGWRRTERLINKLFQDDRHCADSYQSELESRQNAPDYR